MVSMETTRKIDLSQYLLYFSSNQETTVNGNGFKVKEREEGNDDRMDKKKELNSN
jgi:hypothetical protein